MNDKAKAKLARLRENMHKWNKAYDSLHESRKVTEAETGPLCAHEVVSFNLNAKYIYKNLKRATRKYHDGVVEYSLGDNV